MFDTNYYCLVAGLREYSLDGGAKGFDPHAILDEILRELTPRDLRAVRLLYGYYDCKNLIALRAGSPAHDPLGNFARERLKEETEHPRLLPHAIGLVLASTGTSWVTTTWPSSCAVRRPPTSACGANCPTSMR